MIDTFLSCVDDTRPLLDTEPLARRWGDPSSLERMTNGELAGHLARAVFNVAAYLDAPADHDPVDAPGYFAALDGVRAPDLDAELPTSVRRRARDEAGPGPDTLRRRWDETRADLGSRLASTDPTSVIAVRGSAMRVDDYLVTRIVELVVHADDLATGLGLDTPDFDDPVWSTVLDCLWSVARRSSPPLAIVRRMSRVERSDGDPLRVF